MFKKVLLVSVFGIIMTVFGVAATPTELDKKTVSSKAYVDTMIETKQLKIPAAGQPNVGAGETVMTYTPNGNGEIGERGLYSDISSYDATRDGDKLITAAALNATFTNLPTTDTTKLECADPGTCSLWTIVDQTAYGDLLPAGYTQLEYIESTGTQYINTGIPVKANTLVSSDFAFTNSTASTRRLFGKISGSAAAALNYRETAPGNNTPNFYWFGSNSVTTSSNAKHTIDFNADGNVYLDGTVIGTKGPFNSGNNYPMYLFAELSDGQAINYGQVKVYRFTIKEGDTLVQNLIPARHDSDGVLGMYDTVTNTFFTNAATSGPDFTAGPAI